jgi:hypothetical protein
LGIDDIVQASKPEEALTCWFLPSRAGFVPVSAPGEARCFASLRPPS